MLTTKFKKGDKEPPKGSRMELGTKANIPSPNFPDVTKYLKDEKYWALRDAMQKMADSHGKLFQSCLSKNIKEIRLYLTIHW